MRVLEIGTTIESTLALAATLPALRMLIAITPDAALAAEARRRFSDAGLADRISVIIAEPRRFVHKVRGPFDMIVQHEPDADASLHDALKARLAPDGVLIRGDQTFGL